VDALSINNMKHHLTTGQFILISKSNITIS